MHLAFYSGRVCVCVSQKSGTYKNRDKVSNALRRLSNESEKSAEKFYEMFYENNKEYEFN